MAIVRGQSTMQRVTSPSSSPDASPSPPPPATPPPSPGASQQVMVSIAVAQGTAESFHRGACIANLAMSLAFAQVPSQAPLLYDSSHADAPPHTMLRHSGSLHQIAEPNKPPRRYAIVELQIQTIHRHCCSFVAHAQGSSAHGYGDLGTVSSVPSPVPCTPPCPQAC